MAVTTCVGLTTTTTVQITSPEAGITLVLAKQIILASTTAPRAVLTTNTAVAPASAVLTTNIAAVEVVETTNTAAVAVVVTTNTAGVVGLITAINRYFVRCAVAKQSGLTYSIRKAAMSKLTAKAAQIVHTNTCEALNALSRLGSALSPDRPLAAEEWFGWIETCRSIAAEAKAAAGEACDWNEALVMEAG